MKKSSHFGPYFFSRNNFFQNNFFIFLGPDFGCLKIGPKISNMFDFIGNPSGRVPDGPRWSPIVKKGTNRVWWKNRYTFVSPGIGMGVGPLYLSEISPLNLRGLVGALNQVVIVAAINVSQLLGLEDVLGSNASWHYLFG